MRREETRLWGRKRGGGALGRVLDGWMDVVVGVYVGYLGLR